ncbi:acyltransferase family protein [Undibacterium sp. JH2W]|uniref:acyltransferase family protein n=1 Tax=Undibacterium sp. JH2W TaxID=3413037 RepID=UPI003BEF4D09
MTSTIKTDTASQTTSDLRIHLPFLDGMRALAALWVMLGHAHLFAYGWLSHTNLLMKPWNVFLYLHLAVVVFLVLSGFCLALPVVRNKLVLRQTYREFLQSRAMRILPPYFATLILILIINYFFPIATWARNSSGLTSSIPWQVLAVNFSLMQDFFPQSNTINGPFWSIATEWHLYMFFPALILILRRFGGLALLFVATAAAWGLVWVADHPPAFLFENQISILHPPYFCFLFGIGMFSAWLVFGQTTQERVRKRGLIFSLVGAVFIVYFLYLIQKFSIYDARSAGAFFDRARIIDTVFAVVVAVFLAWLARGTSRNWIRKFLELRVFTEIGKFSYSLYLVHIPIFAIIHHYIEEMHLSLNLQHLHFILLSVCGTLATLAFAWGFARIFETRLWLDLLVRVSKLPVRGLLQTRSQ